MTRIPTPHHFYRPKVRAVWPVYGLWLALGSAFAQAPDITRVDPLGFRPDATTHLTITGDRLSADSTLWSTLPVRVVNGSAVAGPERLELEATLEAAPQPALGAWRLANTNGLSALQLTLVDPLPAVPTAETNRSSASAQLIHPPVAVDSQCDELTSRFFQLELRRRERVVIDVVAQRLGSPLDPFLRVLDAHGHELANADDSPGCGADAQLVLVAPERGRYLIEVRDTRHDGGPRHRFRLRVGDFELSPLHFQPLAAAIPGGSPPLPVHVARSAGATTAKNSVEALTPPVLIRGRFEFPRDRHVFSFTPQAGETLRLRGRTRSLGSPCDLYLRLEKPVGTKLTEANATGADEGTLTQKFAEGGQVRLVVEELNRAGGPGFDYELEIIRDTAGFALSVEKNSVAAAPGHEFALKVNCVRHDFDGPITLALAGMSDGFTWTNQVIAAKQTNTTMKVTIPAALRAAEWVDFAVTGSATIGEAKFETRASTLPALRAQFPAMLFPPRELDGLITLGVRAE